MALPESRAALLTCLGRQVGASPPGVDEARAPPESGPGVAPRDLGIGCPEPSERHADPPKQDPAVSDLCLAQCLIFTGNTLRGNLPGPSPNNLRVVLITTPRQASLAGAGHTYTPLITTQVSAIKAHQLRMYAGLPRPRPWC